MVLEIIKSSDKALIGKRFILEPEEAKKQDSEGKLFLRCCDRALIAGRAQIFFIHQSQMSL